MELEERKYSELKRLKQIEKLTVKDTTFDTFVLTVPMVTESYMVLFCMSTCINLLIQT